MKKGIVFALLMFVLSGCFWTKNVCRIRVLEVDHVDQGMNSGNCGYVLGTVPSYLRNARKNYKKRQILELDMTPLFDSKK